MPAFLEKRLKSEYGQNSSVPYAIMNSIGAMHGNKETSKGRAMAREHAHKMAGVKPGKKLSLRNMAKATA